jgi:hypothetical protein
MGYTDPPSKLITIPVFKEMFLVIQRKAGPKTGVLLRKKGGPGAAPGHEWERKRRG